MVDYSCEREDDFSDLSRIVRASAPYRRGGNHVKGQGRARRPNMGNCIGVKQRRSLEQDEILN